MLRRAQWRAIVQHLESAYPEESCGLLLGTIRDAVGEVSAVYPTPNAWEPAAERRTRFLIAPEDFVRAVRYAEQNAWEVIGFFHSHPDHPPLLSDVDHALAWSAMAMLIVSVRAGRVAEARAWWLSEDGAFAEMLVRVQD